MKKKNTKKATLMIAIGRHITALAEKGKALTAKEIAEMIRRG